MQDCVKGSKLSSFVNVYFVSNLKNYFKSQDITFYYFTFLVVFFVFTVFFWVIQLMQVLILD